MPGRNPSLCMLSVGPGLIPAPHLRWSPLPSFEASQFAGRLDGLVTTLSVSIHAAD